MRELAAKARAEGTAKARVAEDDEDTSEEEETEADAEARAEREELRKDRKRDMRRDLRMSNMVLMMWTFSFLVLIYTAIKLFPGQRKASRQTRCERSRPRY